MAAPNKIRDEITQLWTIGLLRVSLIAGNAAPAIPMNSRRVGAFPTALETADPTAAMNEAELPPKRRLFLTRPVGTSV